MDRRATTERTPACNSGLISFKTRAAQRFADTFVVNQRLVLRINIFGKNRQLLVDAKRYKQPTLFRHKIDFQS